MSKSPRQLPICLQSSETNVDLFVFIGALCDDRAYTVPQHEKSLKIRTR